jgi:hypothetical protein
MQLTQEKPGARRGLLQKTVGPAAAIADAGTRFGHRRGQNLVADPPDPRVQIAGETVRREPHRREP